MPANNGNRGFYTKMPSFADPTHPNKTLEVYAYHTSSKPTHAHYNKRKRTEDGTTVFAQDTKPHSNNYGDRKRRRVIGYRNYESVPHSSYFSRDLDSIMKQHRFARKWYFAKQPEISVSPPLSFSDPENQTTDHNSDKENYSTSVFEAALNEQHNKAAGIPFFEEPTTSKSTVKEQPLDTTAEQRRSNIAVVNKEIIIDDDIVLMEVMPETITIDEDAKNVVFPQMFIKQEPQSDDSFVDDCAVDELLNGSFTHVKNDANTTTETAAGSTHPRISESIDGNVEFQSAAPGLQRANEAIKINITRTLPPLPVKQKPVVVEEQIEDIPNYEDYTPINIKPALKDVKLKKQPKVNRDHESTALCSIM